MDSSLGFAGVGLNVPERTKLEVLMAKTRAEEKLSEINFWGKIYGKEADYLICCGTKKAFTSVPVKVFYVWYVVHLSLSLSLSTYGPTHLVISSNKIQYRG
jgi:hypothetical protein